MTAASTQPGVLDGYQLRLPIYEGPLDVLLRLIERNQLSVTDVSLVAVTEQFLEYVSALSDVPPDTLADFTTIAARLLLLKSRSLLPAPAKEEDEPEPDDLTQQLLAYQAAKAAAEDLRRREAEGWRTWGRIQAPAPDLPSHEWLAPVPLTSLVKALGKCLHRTPSTPTRYTPTPVISLAAMTRRLLTRLGFGRTRFSALVGHSASRAELTVGFVALLSLVRQRVIDASQTSIFGEIEIERRATPEAADD